MSDGNKCKGEDKNSPRQPLQSATKSSPQVAQFSSRYACELGRHKGIFGLEWPGKKTLKMKGFGRLFGGQPCPRLVWILETTSNSQVFFFLANISVPRWPGTWWPGLSLSGILQII